MAHCEEIVAMQEQAGPGGKSLAAICRLCQIRNGRVGKNTWKKGDLFSSQLQLPGSDPGAEAFVIKVGQEHDWEVDVFTGILTSFINSWVSLGQESIKLLLYQDWEGFSRQSTCSSFLEGSGRNNPYCTRPLMESKFFPHKYLKMLLELV